MTRAKTLSFFLLSLVVLTNCHTFLRQIPAATKQIPIKTDTSGFYVDTTFLSAQTPQKAKMALSIGGSQALFGTSCLGFTKLVCEKQYSCDISFTLLPFDFPYVSSQSYFLTASTDSDSTFWSLASQKLYATECSGSNALPKFGTDRLGVIGMGLFEYNWESSAFPRQFSFDLNKDLSSGTLFLGPNPSKAAEKTLVTTLHTNYDWVAFAETSISVGSKRSQLFNLEMFFDLNSDAVGFRSALYQEVLLLLKIAVPSLICSVQSYKPTCFYPGDIKNLPPITIDADGSQQALSIPPEVYVDRVIPDTVPQRIVLNIKEIDSSLSGPNYYNPGFAGGVGRSLVILDAKFVSYSSTEFDFSDEHKPQIRIYKPSA